MYIDGFNKLNLYCGCNQFNKSKKLIDFNGFLIWIFYWCKHLLLWKQLVKQRQQENNGNPSAPPLPSVFVPFGLFVQNSSWGTRAFLSVSKWIKAAAHTRAANGEDIKAPSGHTHTFTQTPTQIKLAHKQKVRHSVHIWLESSRKLRDIQTD